ncbi:MAG: hypothetical protein ACI9XO_002550 [Paraglaciecola sp.]|jgi:hypothetical protein
MKKILFFFILFFALFSTKNATAQANFYHQDTIQEIKIYFEPANWDYLLDSLYVAGEKGRLLASLEINGEPLDSVGIRYKGFSSVSTDRAKNPFNIKLDYVKGNQKYDGIDKIKLSNVIQDPSFVRETLSYEISRKYLPVSRANYANVFINDVFWGIYTNVEAVNKDFIAQHYGSNDNAFFKGSPADLDLDGDDNSNLSNEHGTDTTAYYPFYDKESDDGWADLYELIDVLNENPADIETVLNVDRTLWMHAFNYALVNFDSYVGFAQNYYLYKDDNGRFNPVLWDLNQSFASYRLTDASENFDGFSIEQAKTIDPLLHYSSVSVYPRPLMRNLFENDTYRRIYIAHLRTIIEENFANQSYATRAQELQNLIENSVLADSNKFYSNDDFYNNLTSTVADLVDYPGITDLMDARTTYLQNYDGYQGAPTISNLDYAPQSISIGDNLTITAEVVDAENVTLAYRFGGNGLFQKIAMLDDGMQNDGAANDGVFGAQISNTGNSIQYYIYAENAVAGQFSPARAAYEYYLIQSNINTGDVVINELLAANGETQADEAGEFDDWIELYNTTDFDISTAGLYLSDDIENLQKWALPDVVISGDDYLIVWADSDEEQGTFHAGFKLSASGEVLLLSDENMTVLDSITFGEQTEDVSFARLPNGTGPFEMTFPSFNAENGVTGVGEEFVDADVTLFPNPVSEAFYLKFEKEIPRQLQVFSMDGKLMKTQEIADFESWVTIEITGFSSGIYYVNMMFERFVLNRKIVVKKIAN